MAYLAFLWVVELTLLLVPLCYIEGFILVGPSRAEKNVLPATTALASTTLSTGSTTEGNNSNRLSANRIYLDIAVKGAPLGRLVFDLTNPSPLPLHAENLCQGHRRSIDPAAHYVGCTFDYSDDYIEDGQRRYRWGHVLRGRGRNAVGRSDQPILAEAESPLLACTHFCYGGQYYGTKYEEIENDPGVMLTVSLMGPGRGTSRFSIVRVGESPREWKESLLLNSGVVGRLDPSCVDTLHAMARQRSGPPTVTAAGVFE
jgi:hypothetical protein